MSAARPLTAAQAASLLADWAHASPESAPGLLARIAASGEPFSLGAALSATGIERLLLSCSQGAWTVATAGFRAAGPWTCPGCGTGYPEAGPGLVAGHLRACDYTDAAGMPYPVTLKWSVVHWHIATVSSADLAAAAGARPFTELAGVVLDRDDADPDAALAGYLDSLEAARGPARDGWEISRIYDARRDQRQA